MKCQFMTPGAKNAISDLPDRESFEILGHILQGLVQHQRRTLKAIVLLSFFSLATALIMFAMFNCKRKYKMEFW